MAGIEVENPPAPTSTATSCTGNTGGIQVVDLPDLPVQGDKRIQVHDNEIYENNTRNFAEAGSIVGIVPQGTGIIVLSSDNNEFHNNNIRDNQSIGIAFVSYFLTQRKQNDPTYDPYPEGNYVHDNTFDNNGTDPQGMALALATLAGGASTVEDLVWDGVVDTEKDNSDGSLTNCFENNGGATFRNLDAGSEPPFANSSTDIAPNTCSQDPLPAINLEG